MSSTPKPSPKSPVTRTLNGRPAMAGGNAVSQAVKPSKARITLPQPPGTVVPIDEYEKLQSELREKNRRLLEAENRHARNQALIEDMRAQLCRLSPG